MTAASQGSPCRVCGNASGNTRFRAREMMFGTRDEFDYLECAACGCVQIATPPADLGRYYPGSYYSLGEPTGNGGRFRAQLNAIRLAHQLGDRSLLGQLLVAWRGRSPEVAALARLNVSRDAAILDVGCGRGDLLCRLASVGFTRLHGVDPFIPDDLCYASGVRIWKASLESHEGTYDVVMLHHSLEHIADHDRAMAALRRLLAPTGVAIVRTPAADSYAWQTYRTDWAQLDAPRHHIVHTRRSMCIVAERAELTVAQVVYDSTAFQFWASELYRNDVPLYRDLSGRQTSDPGLSRRQMRRYERQARELNQQHLGDQACYFLRHRAPA